MRETRGIPHVAPLVASLLLVAPALRAEEGAVAPVEVESHGVAYQLDNDLFGTGSSDRDYSWGATLTFGSSGPGRALAPADRLRERISSWLPGPEAAVISRASQVGIIAMTPDDLKVSAPQPRDRPYANLVYLTNSELSVGESGDRAQFTSLTLGVLGTDVAEGLQRAVHEVQGGIRPQGWDHQISDGGEPTARFVVAEQWLLGDGGARAAGSRQTKLTLAGSAGYLTEASAAISMRWGRIQTPWWSFNPELGDYAPAAIAPYEDSGSGAWPEIYGFVGARVKARAYNALLQGQFRDSDVRVASDDLARFQAEAWAGVTADVSQWHLTYSIHFASREITREPADRTLVWASLSVSRAF